MEIIEVFIAFLAAVGIMYIGELIYELIDRRGYDYVSIYFCNDEGLYDDVPDAIAKSDHADRIVELLGKEYDKIYIDKENACKWTKK